jgi:hypothetical protein
MYLAESSYINAPRTFHYSTIANSMSIIHLLLYKWSSNLP